MYINATPIIYNKPITWTTLN